MLVNHRANKYEQPYKSALTLLCKLIPKELYIWKLVQLWILLTLDQSIHTNDVIQLSSWGQVQYVP